MLKYNSTHFIEMRKNCYTVTYNLKVYVCNDLYLTEFLPKNYILWRTFKVNRMCSL
jgi:hypothetical protein